MGHFLSLFNMTYQHVGTHNLNKARLTRNGLEEHWTASVRTGDLSGKRTTWTLKLKKNKGEWRTHWFVHVNHVNVKSDCLIIESLNIITRYSHIYIHIYIYVIILDHCVGMPRQISPTLKLHQLLKLEPSTSSHPSYMVDGRNPAITSWGW